MPPGVAEDGEEQPLVVGSGGARWTTVVRQGGRSSRWASPTALTRPPRGCGGRPGTPGPCRRRPARNRSPSGLSRRRQNTTSRNPPCFTPKITWNMGSLISVQSSQIKGTWAIFSMKKEWKKSPETRPWGHGVMLGKVDLQLRLADEERGCCLTNYDRSYG